jgi:lysozyme
MSECTALYGEDWFNFPGEVKSILINMMFNLGRTRLGKFKKMNAAIKAGDWEEAAKEGRDSLWYRQVTNRAERLMRRMELIDD